jgi:chromosome segregation protein
MRIRRIELHGFKSFVDRTTFQFGPGISGVVGPNGCGKSNLIDAIKWTLGEQSPSTLRGKEMLDVIFAGAEGRRPSNMAEVTVAFDNEAGTFGGTYARFDEIEVGRRLFRDGTSNYLLNRTPCRRKDIVGLFLDTGVGARAFSIIEQGRVDFAINARPEERRLLVDEVAGVNRFKTQRQEAERRMDRTRDNLVRVADLMQEMGRQRRALSVQAGHARRYRELRARWKGASLRALTGIALRDRTLWRDSKGELRDLKVAEATAREALEQATAEASSLRDASGEARRRHEQLRDRRGEVSGKQQLRARELQLRTEEQRSLELRLDRLKGDSTDLDRQVRDLQREAKQAQAALVGSRRSLLEMDGLLAEAARREEQARREARAARSGVEATKAKLVEAMTRSGRSRNLATLLERQVREVEERLATQAEQLAEADREGEAVGQALVVAEEALELARRERNKLAERSREVATALKGASQRLKETRASLSSTEERRASTAARLGSLQELIRGLEGFGEGARLLVAELEGTDQVLGTVADLLRTPEELESEVELVLGDRLRGLVVRNPAEAARRVPPGASGRLLLVPAEPLDLPPLPGSLAERVGAEGVSGLAERLLGDAVPTGEGSVAVRSGLWTGGDDGGSGLLAQRRTARRLEVELTGLVEQVASARAIRDTRAEEVRELEEARATVAAEVHEAELAELTRRRDLDEARARRERFRQATQRAEAERTRMQANLATRREELAGARAEATEQDAARARHDDALEELRAEATRTERQSDQVAAATNALRVELATAQQSLAGHQRDARRLDGQLAEVQRRQERAVIDLQAGAARQGQLEQLIKSLGADAAELQAEHTSLGKEVVAAAAVREEAAAGWQRAEEHLRDLRSRLDGLRRDVGSREVALAEARTALQACRARAAEDFDLELDPVLDALVTSNKATVTLKGTGRVQLERHEVSDGRAIERCQAEAATAQARLDTLGPVNLAADAEYAEIDERYSEIQCQRDDLDKAMTDLRRAIAKIERETRERFQDAFARVTERFSALYPRLVGGGRAELQLTLPGDLLATGIDIVVEPPGKRLQNLSLLSGGEKAMAAIALVFAVFQVKPSPFCLLDEVDAPLDDSNSRSFNAMLREMSAETQFVVITHNRRTMEIADVLYGVTMQKPGVSSVVSVRME